MPVAARRLAAELMNTIAERGSRTGRAAAATRKCARVLTAKTASYCSAVVPAMPRPRPMPTLSTRPSRPPRAAADSATTAAHAAGCVTSASTTSAADPSARTSSAVISAAAPSLSAQATAAPSRAASTAMARPLPGGASGSSDGRVPAPTTRTRRPASRPRPGAEPVASGGRYGYSMSLTADSEPDRHVLDAVDEVRAQPARVAVQPDAGHPLGQRLQQDAQLQRREMPAEAEVRTAAAEADVRIGIAADVELVPGGEHLLVPVRRGIEHHDLVPGGDLLPAELGAAGRSAAEQVDRA